MTIVNPTGVTAGVSIGSITIEATSGYHRPIPTDDKDIIMKSAYTRFQLFLKWRGMGH